MLGTKRVDSLVDGVFAIAMTLLAFGLTVSNVFSSITDFKTVSVISNIWPHFIVYVLSFIILGFYWVEHKIQYDYIKFSSKYLLWVNIFFLMFIALIPFSTGVLGSYINEKFSILIYGINVILIGILSYVHWEHAYSHKMIYKNVPSKVTSEIKRSILVAPVIAIFSIILSSFSLIASLIIYLLIPIYYIFLSKIEFFRR